jgi:flagellar biosynthetic protein FliP
MQRPKNLLTLLLVAVLALGAALAFAALAVPGRALADPAAGAAATGTTLPGGTSSDNAPANAPDLGGYSQNGSGAATSTPVTAQSPAKPQTPASPSGASGSSGGSVSINLGGSLSKPGTSLTIIIALTLLAVAPSLLILLTSFTRIIIVLSLTRQALGLQNVPPNQVLAGLALFLSLFIMSPVISQANSQAVQPYLAGKITAQQAYTDVQAPLKTWMLKQTQSDDLALFAAPGAKPASPSAMPMSAIVPAFALSEMRAAFIIGFVIFVPFLVIDLVVSSTLMSLGMMMLPPTLVSLPFKLLLFILVNGWALVVQSLITSFH